MGNFSFLLWAISVWFRHWKNFKNRPTFAKVTVKIKVAQFFWLTVYIGVWVCLMTYDDAGDLGGWNDTLMSSSIFSHLRSLWTMPRRWQYSMASHIWRNQTDACFSGIRLYCCTVLSRLPPLASSIMIYTRVLVSIAYNVNFHNSCNSSNVTVWE